MKLRVMCNDPYVTDSSSSEDEKYGEEYSGKSSCHKQFVREIIVSSPPRPKISVPAAPANHHDRHPAEEQTKLGKSGAFICDPVIENVKTEWVGLYDTRQEIAVTYAENTLDYDSIVQSNNLSCRSSALEFNSNITNSNCSINEEPASSAHGVDVLAPGDCVRSTNYQGVSLTKSGKWGAHIWHAIRKKEIWLGTFSTAQEAADAYDRKKLELESIGAEPKKTAPVSKLIKPETMVERPAFSQDDGISLCGNKYESHIMEERHLCPAAEQIKTKKWGSFSKHPMSWERSSLCGLTLPVAENLAAFRKHKGVALTKSGKWKAHIWHPIKKKEIWLGAYFSAEEAVDAYDRKKLEFKSLVVGSKKKSDFGCIAATQDSKEDKPCFSLKNGVLPAGNKDEGHIREEKHLQFKRLVSSKLAGNQSSSSVIEIAPTASEYKSGEEEGSREEHAVPQGKDALITSGNNRDIEGEQQPTIWQTQSGKWGTSIRDPIRKMTDWCGSYNSPEEAANIFPRKRVKSETEICARKEERNLASKRSKVREKHVIRKRCWEEFVVTSNSDDADVASKRKNLEPLGVRFKKSASDCKALTRESIEDKSCCSREDGVSLAESKGGGHISEERHLRPAAEQTETEKWESIGKHLMNWGRSSLHGIALSVAGNRVASSRHKGVALTKSGKWRAHIWHPIEKKEIGLGVYFSAEEAADAYNRKKLEFESLVVGSKKNPASVDAYSDDAAIKNVDKPHNMQQSLVVGNRSELDLCSSRTQEEAENSFNEKKLESQSPPTSASEAEKSGVTYVGSHESDGIGSNSTVEALSYTMESEFGCGIINCYGQLLGEYSKLDDELWLSNPDEDDQDTMGSDELFAWELKPPVKLSSVV